MGLRVDPQRNEAVRGAEQEISPAGSGGRVFVVPTNEELLIARDTCRIVTAGRSA
jgi:acetate kinase